MQRTKRERKGEGKALTPTTEGGKLGKKCPRHIRRKTFFRIYAPKLCCDSFFSCVEETKMWRPPRPPFLLFSTTKALGLLSSSFSLVTYIGPMEEGGGGKGGNLVVEGRRRKGERDESFLLTSFYHSFPSLLLHYPIPLPLF